MTSVASFLCCGSVLLSIIVQCAFVFPGHAEANLDAQIALFSSTLENNTAELKLRIGIGLATPAADRLCDFAKACSGGRVVPHSFTLNFTEPLSIAAVDFVQVEQFDAVTGMPIAFQGTARPEPCALAGMRPSWSRTVTQSQGVIGYQELLSPDNLVGNYPARPTMCTGGAMASRDRRFAGAATGPKDVVILADFSTSQPELTASGTSPVTAQLVLTSRVQRIQAISRAILDTLTYKDWVALLPFDDAADPTVDRLTQAGEDAVAELYRKVSNWSVSGSESFTARTSVRRAALFSALQSAATLLRRSKAAGHTSGCNSIIVLLSSGTDDFRNSLDASQALATTGVTDIPVLSVYVSTSVSTKKALADGDLLLRRIACATSGLYRQSNEDSNPLAVSDLLVLYFQRLTQAEGLLWGESSLQPTSTLGEVFSLSLPVYVVNDSSLESRFFGVATMEVSWRSVDPTGSWTNASMLWQKALKPTLLSAGVCAPLNAADESRASALASMQDSPCPNETSTGTGDAAVTGEKLQINKLKGLLVVGSVCLVLLVGLVPVCLTGRDPSIVVTIATLLFFVFWIVAFSVFFSFVLNDVIQVHYFVPTVMDVRRVAMNPFACCNVVNCVCEEYTPPLGNASRSCDDAQSTLTAVETCGNGFFCCGSSCSPCNCRTVFYECEKGGRCGKYFCSTCCKCQRAINNQRCQVACGTCHKPIASVNYTFEGRAMESSFQDNCNRDDFGCSDRFARNFKEGTSVVGYVNPEFPLDIRGEVGYRTRTFVVFLVFACLSAIPLIAAYTVALRRCFSTDQDNGSPTTTNEPTSSPIDHEPPGEGDKPHPRILSMDEGNDSVGGVGMRATQSATELSPQMDGSVESPPRHECPASV